MITGKAVAGTIVYMHIQDAIKGLSDERKQIL